MHVPTALPMQLLMQLPMDLPTDLPMGSPGHRDNCPIRRSEKAKDAEAKVTGVSAKKAGAGVNSTL